VIEDCSLALPALPNARVETDLAALVDTYAPLLFRVAHALLRNPAEAEDAVQDTFVRVLQHIQKAHHPQLPAIRDLRVWLVRITWNLALDRRRRIRPDQIDPTFAAQLAASLQPADHALQLTQQFNAVLTELERLPRLERQALLLSAIDELSTAEIASILHRSPSAVRALIHRSRTRLRERLQKAGHA
jgi:RNA polymerase sigma-70 factor (ECF subfamily)